jgi:elongation factor 2
MGRKEENIARVEALMSDLKHVRNIGTAAHIDHGKTTLSDSLLSGAGLISEELAGTQLALDYDEQEQARGITINAVNASMVHEFEGTQYLINLIDTPGHVDFGGDVTRAMRALDGVILVVCAVEGVMPQTETVIRQAMKEAVRPVLFINKVDRLINELKVSPEEMQKRFVRIISEVNERIKKYAPDDFKTEWQVNVEKGTVGFGSAFNKWATSVPWMKKNKVTFKDIYDHCKNGTQKELSKKSPVHQVILDMSVKHHPDPPTAQKYRIPKIWHGPPDSPVGKAMLIADPNGPIALMVNKIIVDPHAGEVAIGRLYSGTIERGKTVYISGMGGRSYSVALVAVAVGADRMPVDKVLAGNMAAVSGLRDAISGSTVSSEAAMEPFEPILHYSEPVVTVAIEAKHTRDLPKLIEVLRSISKADPSIIVEINNETGEHLISGMGELHLEITQYRIVVEHKVEINTSTPIVVYRESVKGPSPTYFEGKSPNKHNKFYVAVEPLEQAIVDAIKAGDIPAGERIKDKKVMAAKFVEFEWDKDDAKGVTWIQDTNILVDNTKGIQNLHETMELCKDAFIEACNRGPLCNEKLMAVKARLVDAKLHEDSIHRGPGQVIPSMRSAVYGAMITAGTQLMEPYQKVFINVPNDVMGSAAREIQTRRGEIIDMKSEGEITTIESICPVAEMFGFASAIRSATQGRALWSTENAGFRPVPRELQPVVVKKIRERKGLKPDPPTADYYAS